MDLIQSYSCANTGLATVTFFPSLSDPSTSVSPRLLCVCGWPKRRNRSVIKRKRRTWRVEEREGDGVIGISLSKPCGEDYVAESGSESTIATVEAVVLEELLCETPAAGKAVLGLWSG